MTIDTFQKEVDVQIKASEIDIVHRTGRRQESKPGPVLVKFMSHKTKEMIMRNKKNAQNVRIYEDLAPGIKQMYDDVSKNGRYLNIDCVWTIDGQIKFRFVGSPHPF